MSLGEIQTFDTLSPISECLRGIDTWIRSRIHHQSNYNFKMMQNNTIQLSFNNQNIMNKLIEDLCCKLLGCNLETIKNKLAVHEERRYIQNSIDSGD